MNYNFPKSWKPALKQSSRCALAIKATASLTTSKRLLRPIARTA